MKRRLDTFQLSTNNLIFINQYRSMNLHVGLILEYRIGCVKRKSAFDHGQNACMFYSNLVHLEHAMVSSRPLHSIIHSVVSCDSVSGQRRL